MSYFNEEEFREGLVSELVLLDLPATQTSVSDAYYEEIRPLSQVSSEGPFEFKISGQNSIDYLDLKNSQIHLKVRVVKGDGSALTAEKVGPAIFFFKLCSVLQRLLYITRPASPATTIHIELTFNRCSTTFRMLFPVSFKLRIGL